MNNPNNDDYKTTGTPKTIEEALENAQEEIDSTYCQDQNAVRLNHIRDFLAQKAFDKDQTKAANFIEYFHKIFPKKKSQIYEIMDEAIRGSR